MTTHLEIPASPLAHPHVLLLDDDPRIVRCLRRGLIRDHHVVTETESPRAMARIQQGERYDVIVTDLAMAEISGAQLYAEIHKIDRLQAERILFVTGGASNPDASQFLNTVTNPTLVKPFEISALRKTIGEIIVQKGLVIK
jgi:CheY-like chemotaxis protein